MAKKDPDLVEDNDEPETKSSGIGGLIWIIPIIAIAVLGWIIYLWFSFEPGEEIMGATLEDWRIGSIFILMILVVVLILVHPSGKLATKPEPAQKAAGTSKKARSSTLKETKPTKMVVIEALETEKDAEKVKEAKMEPVEFKTEPAEKDETETDIADAEIIAPPAKKVTPDILEYPKKIEGGIYGDTFIKVNDQTTLKLRTLVVEDVYLS